MIDRSILSRASEVGASEVGRSPTNHLGSGQRLDTGQGSSSPSTGGLDLTPTGEPPKHLDKVNVLV